MDKISQVCKAIQFCAYIWQSPFRPVGLLDPSVSELDLLMPNKTPINRIAYKDPNGTERTWESAERRTRPENSEIDGVGIVAILEKSTGEEAI